jgi:murein DD-endopeptidase MepM/ murein hydrolase activator NlpD
MKLFNPAPGRPVTSPYGPRRHPITGQLGKMHRGIDYGGTFDVLSAGDGIVHKVSYNGNKINGGGHVVIIKHATNLFTVYYHGAHATSLKVGDRVRKGQFIYRSGSTGASTGPHLHFEVRTGAFGQEKTDADPMAYLDRNVPVTVKPVPLKVDGKLGRATWKAWQEALKRDWGYEGIIDGIPGELTYTAIQRSAGAKTDGLIGPDTRKRVQMRLKASNFYLGPIDGIWGKGTITALQRALNQNKY